MSPREDKPFQQRMQRIEALVQEVEQLTDPAPQAAVRELVQSLLDLHGAGLAKMLDLLARTGESGQASLAAFAADGLIGSLLLLHGLHPVDLETRVRLALDKVRPYLRSHGGNVELLDIADGAVRLRIQGSCHACPPSAQALQQAIEEALYEVAPDVTALEVEGGAPPAPSHGLVALPVISGPGLLRPS